MLEENKKSFENLNDVNIGRYVRLIFLQSKIVLFITLAGLIAGSIIYFSSNKTYKISSLLQVYSPNQSFDPRQTMSLDFFNAPETNLDNLTKLYLSRANIMNLIGKQKLNLELENLEDKEKLNIQSLTIKSEEEFDKKTLQFRAQGDSFTLLDENEKLIAEGLNGEYLNNDDLEIQISFSDISPQKSIKIIYENPSNLYNYYKDLIVVESLTGQSSFWIQEGLLQSSLITEDISKGKKYLNTLNNIFINDNITVESEKAKKTISFINNQLDTLEEVLDLRKDELRSFKQQNKSLNVNLEVQAIIEQIAEVEQKINKVDLDLSQAEVNFTKDNPLFINLKIQRDALEMQKKAIENEIESLPNAQQEYIDLFRNLEASEALFLELQNRKLNYSLIEASTIGNIRVVDRAFVENLVGPKLSLVFYMTLISFIFGIVVAIFRGIFFISISNPAELSDAGLNENIIGVIPKVENTDKAFEDQKFEQSLETSILNIETVLTQTQTPDDVSCKKIVLTSPTASNGKSFISKNIAEGLSRIGHKVLLIDADLKRGDQHRLFNKETINLDFFNKLSSQNIDSLKINKNMYLLPRLKKIKNTFEHLYGTSFISKIKEFETLFDYIIFDTAPVLSVSDTGLLMTSSDNNFLIVRHQINRVNEIKQSLQIIDQIGRKFDGPSVQKDIS